MKIQKLRVRNFGKIHGVDVVLGEGINLCRGGNESGKTTFYYFLKGMFYGLPRKRGKGAGKDSYSQYQPWVNPADFGGSLTFTAEGRTYRLSRNFFRGASSFDLYEEGEGGRLEEKDLMSLLGVGEAVYENTVSVGQLKSVTGPDLNRELMDYMAACQGAADSRVSIDRATQFLKMHRKDFTSRLESVKKAARTEMEKIQTRVDLLERQLSSLKDQEKEAGEKAENAPVVGRKERVREHKKDMLRLRALHKRRNRSLALLVTFLILGLLSLISLAGFWKRLRLWPLRLLWLLVGLLALGGSVYFFFRIRKCRSLEAKVQEKHMLQVREYKRLQEEKQRLFWEVEAIQNQEREREADLENMRAEYLKYENDCHEPKKEEIEIEALNMAMDRMKEASQAIQARLGDSLQRRTGEILSEITEGKYKSVFVDASFHMAVREGERLVDLERLSRGTIEQLYFSLRMASAELLCKKDFPVILDDVFGMYDDERLAAVLRWLSTQKRQVVICSCNHREEELLEKEGIPFQCFSLEGES